MDIKRLPVNVLFMLQNVLIKVVFAGFSIKPPAKCLSISKRGEAGKKIPHQKVLERHS